MLADRTIILQISFMQHSENRKRLLADARQYIRDCSRRRVTFASASSSESSRPAPHRARASSSEPCVKVRKLLQDLRTCVRVPPIILPHALKVDSLRYEVLRKNLVKTVLAGESLQCGGLFNLAEFRDAFWLMKLYQKKRHFSES